MKHDAISNSQRAPKGFPTAAVTSSPTAATTAATPMNSAELSRTDLNKGPMIYWSFEPARTMMNGPNSHGMIAQHRTKAETSATDNVSNARIVMRPGFLRDSSALISQAALT
jgi:hypothetical protein